LGNQLQQCIAGPVPQRFVDHFEAIQIKHANRKRLPLVYGNRQAVGEQRPIWQAGECVMDRLVAKFGIDEHE
jgi:hypothetical protein